MTATVSGTRPGVVASASPKAKEQAKKGEVASDFRRQHGSITEKNVKIPVGRGHTVVRVSVDTDVAWVDKALKDGKLTPAQAVAADRLEKLFRIVYGSPSGRSCCDDSPRGGMSNPDTLTESRSEMWMAADSMEPGSYSILISVLRDGEKTGPRRRDNKRWRLIDDGLTIAANVWRIG